MANPISPQVQFEETYDAVVSRTSLRDWLRHREAAPLEPSIRAFMETRFGTGFADVRVHTGPAAAALCAMLQARAFTLGRHIVFGKGQYAPVTMAGRRLLAHELVHVSQQRSAIPPARSWCMLLGDPLDDCEREADRLAEEALAAGLQSVVTPDATGAIRRAISIIPDSVKLTVNWTDVVPGVDITTDGKVAVLHLTKNAKPLLTGETSSEKEASAVNITGEVGVRLGPCDNVKDWDFHFIQLVREYYFRVGYAGRTKSEGSIALDFSNPPLMPAYFTGKFWLDSGLDMNGNLIMPFTNLRPPKSSVPDKKGGVKITTDMDDHPNSKIPLKNGNFAAKPASYNFLYRASREFEALTVFVARDEAGVIQQLAYVGWYMTWIAKFRWVGGKCFPWLQAKTFAVDPPTIGAVPDSDLAAMIKNPTTHISETYGYLAMWALKHIYDPDLPRANLLEKSSWSEDVPADFWRDK